MVVESKANAFPSISKSLLILFFLVTVTKGQARCDNIQDLYDWYKGSNIHPILEDATGIPCYSEKNVNKAERMLAFFLESPDVIEKVYIEAKKMGAVVSGTSAP